MTSHRFRHQPRNRRNFIKITCSRTCVRKGVSIVSLTAVLCSVLLLGGCQNDIFQKQEAPPPAFKDVPAVRLNYRYEADVPPPSADPGAQPADERDPGIQADFDANRTQELLDRTLTSPDKRNIIA